MSSIENGTQEMKATESGSSSSWENLPGVKCMDSKRNTHTISTIATDTILPNYSTLFRKKFDFKINKQIIIINSIL
jgi:hypothetical protein